MRIIAFLALLGLLQARAAFAQPLQTVFEAIQLANGATMPNLAVFTIAEDHQGFIWFGTREGLMRYDGYQLKTFYHRPEDPTSLPDDHIHHLFCDRQGTLWVITQGGLCQYKASKHQFLPAQILGRPDTILHVHNLWEDARGQLWAGNGEGLWRYLPAKQQFEPVEVCTAEHNEPLDRVGWGATAPNGVMWIIARESLYRFIPEEGRAVLVPLPERLKGKWYPGLYRVLPDSRGELWVQGWPGLVIYNPSTNTWRRIENLPHQAGQNLSRCAVEDAYGNIWTGFRFIGLSRCSPDGYNQLFRPGSSDVSGVFSNRIFSLYIDRAQNLWVGSLKGPQRCKLRQNPLLYLPSQTLPREYNYLFDCIETGDGRFWAGSAEQLLYSPQLGQPMAQVPILSNYLQNEEETLKLPPLVGYTRNKDAKVFCRDPNGGLWAGGTLGLYYAPPQEPIRPIVLGANFDRREVLAITVDPCQAGVVFLLYSHQVVRYNHLSHQIEVTIPLTPQMGTAMDMLIDQHNHLQVAMANGIAELSTESNRVSWWPYSMVQRTGNNPVLSVNALVENPAGGLWLATTKGLYQAQPDPHKQLTRLQRVFPSSDLAAKQAVHTVINDREGQTWFTTHDALWHLTAPDATPQRYAVGANPIGGFVFDASCSLLNGKLAFGGVNGIWVFDPRHLTPDTASLPLVLTAINIPQLGPLTPAPELTTHITLPPNYNAFMVEWAALGAAEPTQLRYSYCLQPHQKNWSETSSTRSAAFFNLKPGQYTLRIRADKGDGRWQTQELSLYIELLPAWWQTWWFKTLVFMALLAVVYRVWGYYIQNRALEEQRRLAEQKAAYKSQFLANMSHEIRTPMNAILGLNKLLLESAMPAKQQEYAEAINESAEQLLWIVNDILDQAKIESGKYSFVHRTFELDTIIRYLERIFTYRAAEKSLAFKVSVAPDVPNQLIGDPVRLNQILTNLLSNAIKYTAQGSISLQVSRLQSLPPLQLSFAVQDTGVGIPAEAHQRIFESFEQIEEEDNPHAAYRQGTGLGLSIVRELITQQGGTISFQSVLRQGSVFTVVLPFEVPSSESGALPLPAEPWATTSVEQLKHTAWRVLLVEDVYLNQVLATELLRKHLPLAEINIAENGQVALEKVNQRSYDLILMDVKMPVMDGYEATRLIRALPGATRTIPILGLTANAIPEQIVRCRESGMDEVVTKPLHIDELLAKISAVLTPRLPPTPE